MIIMIEIKKKNFERLGHEVDFELENGVLLFKNDWNGEIYAEGYNEKEEKVVNSALKPIYRFEEEGMDLENLEENSAEVIVPYFILIWYNRFPVALLAPQVIVPYFILIWYNQKIKQP